MRLRKRRVIAKYAKQVNRTCRLKPVTVLRRDILVQSALAIFKMKSIDSKRGDIFADGSWAMHDSKQDVSRHVVAEGNAYRSNSRNGTSTPPCGYLILQRAIGVRNPVLRQKVHRLIQFEFAQLYLM